MSLETIQILLEAKTLSEYFPLLMAIGKVARSYGIPEDTLQQQYKDYFGS